MSDPKIRVFVADDHPVVREGIKRILEDEPDMEVVGEASDGDAALEGMRSDGVDVALLDVSMPGSGLFRILEQVRQFATAPRVLVVSIQPEETYAVRALRHGATGYLSKEQSPEELATAIRRVHAGRTYLSNRMAEKLALDHIGRTPSSSEERLSGREFQVLGLLGQGKTITDIGEALHLSPKTVSTYRTRLLDKLGLTTTAELVRYAVERGIDPV